jgi:hypothetical protein
MTFFISHHWVISRLKFWDPIFVACTIIVTFRKEFSHIVIIAVVTQVMARWPAGLGYWFPQMEIEGGALHHSPFLL